MISLIKNEMFKLLHKSSLYVIVIITLMFIVLVNYIYNSYGNLLQQSSERIDITEVNEFLDNYDPDIDDISDFAYNIALSDVYGLTYNYEVDSWQYYIFTNDYFNVAFQYYLELYSDNDEEVIGQLKSELLNILQAIYTDNWQYFIEIQIDDLETQISTYQEILESDDLSDENIVEYNRLLFIAEEELELAQYRLDNEVLYGDDYLNDAIYSIQEDLELIASYYFDSDFDTDEYIDIIKAYKVNKYILEEQVDVNNFTVSRSVLMEFFENYAFFIYIFVILIAGTIVSEEYSYGTIKSLLILPHRRSTVIWSKYITVILSAIFLILLLFVSQLLIGGIMYGFSGLDIPVAIYNVTTNSIEALSVFKYFFLYFLANLPKIIIIATFAFGCSTIFKNSMFSVAGTFIFIIAESFLELIDNKIMDYFLTNNWNISVYLFGGTSPYGLTLGFSLLICFTYLILMLLATVLVFTNEDIKNI